MNKNNENSSWEKQKNGQWKSLISSLKNDSEIHSHFNDFITTFYWKFRQKKGITNDAYPEVDFQGFKEFEEHEQRAGHCYFDASQNTRTTYTNGQETRKTVEVNIKLNIFLNQWFLLDRLGVDKLFSNENTYTPTDFDQLIETIAHELAHAYQQTVNNFAWEETRSQCESTGDRDSSGNLLYPELAAEHTALTEEIKGVIESSAEYQEFKKWWKTNESSVNNNEKQNLPERKNKEVDSNSFQSKSDNFDQQTSKANNNNNKNNSNHSTNNKQQNSSKQHKVEGWFGTSSIFLIIGGIIALSLIILMGWLVMRKKKNFNE